MDDKIHWPTLEEMASEYIPDRFDWLQRWGDLVMDPPPLATPLQPTSYPRFNMAEAEARAYTAFPATFSDRMRDVQAFRRLAYNKEDNDCGVRALAVACAAPYEKSHAAFKRMGRYDGEGVCVPMMLHAAPELGYYLEGWPLPANATIKSCGRHYADTDGGYVIVTCDHAAGMWNGEIIDHARNSKARVTKLFRARRLAE